MRTSIKDKINTVIFEQLEQGHIPRKKTRNTIQISGTTGKPYQGINQLLLQINKLKHQYTTNRWLTFNMIKKLGGSIKKEEKASPAIYYKLLPRKDRETDDEKKVPLLKLYRLFNLDQTTLSPSTTADVDMVKHSSALNIRENFKNKPILSSSSYPHYNPMTDTIGMPMTSDFDTEAEYRSTLFHEAIHATGAENRLARKEITKSNLVFGDNDYSKEELVAELGASYLAGFAQIEQHTIKNAGAYIAGRLHALKNDKNILMQAAADGWRGCEYLLGKHQENKMNSLGKKGDFVKLDFLRSKS